MSRIGLKVINVPEGVTLARNNDVLTVKGPKGSLDVKIPSVFELKIEGNSIHCFRHN